MVILDGERREIEVDLARRSLRVGPHEWPIRLGTSANGSVSFEILGERVEVRTELSSNGPPTGTVVVNGELHTLVVESATGTRARAPGLPREGAVPCGPVSASAPGGAGGSGHAVFPPMPGKVLEVRVRNGEKVQAGQVLFVIEAMKMRNEVTAPIAGEVTGLLAAPGTNVSAHDELLRIVGA